MSSSTLLRSNVRAASCRPARQLRSRTVVVPKAGLFGFGKSKAEVDAEREEQYRAQQELLRKRSTGELLKQAEVRRKQVSLELRAKKETRKAEREALAKGEMPDTLRDWKPYDEETEKNSRSGVVIPLIPIGLPKYDAGERFDLRNPFFETGYIDPDEMSPMDSLKRFGRKIFDFSGGKDVEQDARKQVMVPDVERLGKYGGSAKAKQQKKKK